MKPLFLEGAQTSARRSFGSRVRSRQGPARVPSPARSPASAGGGAARWCPRVPPPAGRSRPSPAPRRRAPGPTPRAGRAARRVVELDKPGPPQQRAQRRVAKRGPVEFGEMGVAAGPIEQQGIADVIEATGHPSGPSMRGRRPRRSLEKPSTFFRNSWARGLAAPPAGRPIRVAAAAARPLDPCNGPKNGTKAQGKQSANQEQNKEQTKSKTKQYQRKTKANHRRNTGVTDITAREAGRRQYRSGNQGRTKDCQGTVEGRPRDRQGNLSSDKSG